MYCPFPAKEFTGDFREMRYVPLSGKKTSIYGGIQRYDLPTHGVPPSLSRTLTGTGFERENPSFPRVVFPFMGSHSGAPAEGEQRVPVEQVLNGLEVHALEPGETALEAFILLKVLDRDGDVAWSYRTTNRLSREELLGALTVQVDVLRKSLRDEWDDD
jgi:hypothetical protein